MSRGRRPARPGAASRLPARRAGAYPRHALAPEGIPAALVALPTALAPALAMAGPGPVRAVLAWWAVGLLLAAAVAALALWLWWRRVRRPPPRKPRARREPKPRYPVVLCHGLFGFDEIEVVGSRHAYFRGVPARLEKSSWQVSLARVPGAASVKLRAHELAECVRTVEAPRVNIVAHSMGGIDARYAISRLGLAKRVATLITVGAPHRGTPVADLGDGLAARLGLRPALQRAGLGLEALRDLTVARMETFNVEVPDAPGVAYGSVVGVARRTLRMNPLLVPTWLYLKRRAGENDGIVPASSQRWGEVLAEIEADHWAQIGWSRHFDAADFYARLLRELRGRGF